jgi:hypothetical protein
VAFVFLENVPLVNPHEIWKLKNKFHAQDLMDGIVAVTNLFKE